MSRSYESDLRHYADGLPHMGGVTLGPWLRDWAADCRFAIVEVGCWLGGGTAQLALGARESGATIHTYDWWKANEHEVGLAKSFGVDLIVGQDTLPWVREHLAPFGADICFHQGAIKDAKWPGEPIGLYVDDAAKRQPEFDHVLETFAPHWVDGCVVVLMDYWFFRRAGDEYRYQHDFVTSHRDQFEPIAWEHSEIQAPLDRRSTSAAAFRFTAPRAP